MEKNDNTFNQLAQKLSNTERLNLLEKINSVITPQNESVITEKVVYNDEEIAEKFKSESFIFRIIMIIKTFFSQNDLEEEYNIHLVSKIAKNLEQNFSNIFNYKQRILYYEFYIQLENLANVAHSLKPTIIEYEENEGSFYQFLASLLVTNLSNVYESDINPIKLSLEREVTNELRTSLLRKLDELLNSITPTDKAKIYLSVQSINWLREFVNLPFQKFMGKFIKDIDGQFTCSVNLVHSEIARFASVFCNVKIISPDVIEALFLFYLRSANIEPNSDESNRQLDLYLNKNINYINIINEFQRSVDMHDIGIVAFNSYNWIPDDLPGVEQWFVIFKDQWHKQLDLDWANWKEIKKRENTKDRIQAFFRTSGYPLIPNRPWEQLSDSFICKSTYTLGFLYAFFDKKYPAIYEVLKTLTAKGEFENREYANQFTGMFNDFNHEQDQMMNINTKLDKNGEWNDVFEIVLNEEVRTLQGQSKIKSVMLALEAEVHEIIANFGESCRLANKLLFDAVYDNDKSQKAIITNLDKIYSSSKKSMREKTKNSFDTLNLAYELVKELETLEVRQNK